MNRRVFITVPTDQRGALDAALTRWLLTLPRDAGWDFEIEILNRRPVVSCRNMSVKKFLASGCDVFFTIDDDMVPSTREDTAHGGLALMLEAIARPDVDLVTGVYLKIGDGGPVPILSRFADADRTMAKPDLETAGREPGLHAIPESATGGGVLMFTRDLAERFLETGTPWFKDVFCWDKDDEAFGERLMGQDIWLFKRAQELGFNCFMDTRVHWGHMKSCDLRNQWDAEQSARIESVRLANLPELFAEVARMAWGNERYAASPELLTQMLVYAADVPRDGMVVECGSGISTLALGMILTQENLVSLEHDDGWMRSTIERAPHLAGCIRHAPLAQTNGYDFYAPLEFARPVSLLVIDGPPGDVRGGRSGAMPEMYPHLAPHFRVILDDVDRAAERELMEKWTAEYGLVRTVRQSSDGRAFAVMEGTR